MKISHEEKTGLTRNKRAAIAEILRHEIMLGKYAVNERFPSAQRATLLSTSSLTFSNTCESVITIFGFLDNDAKVMTISVS